MNKGEDKNDECSGCQCEQTKKNGNESALGQEKINWKQIAQQTMSELWLLRQSADKMALAIQAHGWPEQLTALTEYRKLRQEER